MVHERLEIELAVGVLAERLYAPRAVSSNELAGMGA